MHEHEARLERLQADRVETPKTSRRLRLPAGALAGGGPSRSGEIVVRVEGLEVGYLPGRGALDADGRPATEPRQVAAAPFLAAQRGDRIGIVGPNGAGKTTLLRTIAGDLPPLDGTLTFGNAVQPGYLAQLRDAAIPGATVLDALLEAIPVTAGEARAYLARFLFRGEDVFKEVRLAVRRRAIAARARPARDPALEPAPARRADEPPRHRRPRGDRVVPGRVAGDAARRVPRPAAARDRLLHAVGRRRRAGGAVRRRLEGAGGRRWPTAGRSHAAAERERRRLRGAGRGGVGRDGVGAGDAIRRRPSRGPRTARPPTAAGCGGGALGRPAAARSCRRTPTGARRRGRCRADPARAAQERSWSCRWARRRSPANFVEMRRVASELADVEQALAAAEDAWLELEERAP